MRRMRLIRNVLDSIAMLDSIAIKRGVKFYVNPNSECRGLKTISNFSSKVCTMFSEAYSFEKISQLLERFKIDAQIRMASLILNAACCSQRTTKIKLNANPEKTNKN